MPSYTTRLLQAMALEASDTPGSPAIARGVHLRIMPSNKLELPIAPLVVYRVELDDAEAERAGLFRTDGYLLKNRYGTGGDLSSALDSGPSTATLMVPDDDACVYVEVLAAPGSHVEVETQIRRRGDGALTVGRQKGTERVALSGFAIDTVIVQGTGKLLGLRWIGLRDLIGAGRPFTGYLKGAPWAVWSLPVKSGASYLGLQNAAALAQERLRRGAPREWPLSASLAGGAMPAETDVERIAGDVKLQGLLLQVTRSANPRAPITVPVEGLPPLEGRPAPTGCFSPLEHLLVASHEPAVARWLGFADVDTQPPAAGRLVVYVVRSFWAPDRKALGVDAPQLPAAQTFPTSDLLLHLSRPVDASPAQWRSTYEALRRRMKGWSPSAIADAQPYGPASGLLGALDLGTFPLRKSISELWTAAVVRMGSPPELPTAPEALAASGPWRPDQPLDAPVRQATVTVSRLVEGAAFALVRQQGGEVKLLNPKGPGRVGVPLLAGPPAVNGGSPPVGVGVLPDDSCPPEAVVYRVAQRDWAGRWGGWTNVNLAKGVRPPPPVPVVNVVYRAVTKDAIARAADPIKTPLAGGFEITVEIPRELTPGSYPLKRLEIRLEGPAPSSASFTFDGSTWKHAGGGGNPGVSAASGSGAPLLRVTLPGPALAPASAAAVVVTAKLFDAQDTPSQVTPAEPARWAGRATDPRPPVPVPLPKVLAYTSRPDPAGLAWARIDLAPLAGTNIAAYRVYAADDGAVAKGLAGLTSAEAIQLRADLAKPENQSNDTRASLLVVHKKLLPRRWFELVSGRLEPAVVPAFLHAIAGAHAGLMLYRVVAENADGVAVPFEDAPLMAFAVPDSAPPAQPGLVVIGVATTAAGFRVSLRVDLPKGGLPPALVQLRRTQATTTDPQRMLVVQQKPVPEGSAFVELVDELPRSAAWLRMTWVAESRADGPSQDQPGPWSPPSAPAQRVLVPSDAPAPSSALQLVAGGLRFEHAHAARIDGFRVSVGVAGQPPVVRSAAALARDAQGGFTWTWSPAPAPAPGARISVVVIDPRGRASQPGVITA